VLTAHNYCVVASGRLYHTILFVDSWSPATPTTMARQSYYASSVFLSVPAVSDRLLMCTQPQICLAFHHVVPWAGHTCLV